MVLNIQHALLKFNKHESLVTITCYHVFSHNLILPHPSLRLFLQLHHGFYIIKPLPIQPQLISRYLPPLLLQQDLLQHFADFSQHSLKLFFDHRPWNPQ